MNNPVLDLEVFIPSRSRWDRARGHPTLEALKGKWDKVALVVPAKQAARYKPLAAHYGVRLLACPYDGIAHTRRFIGEKARDRFIMLDDDLRFYRRKSVDDWHLYAFNKGDMVGMLVLVARLLDLYAHVCVGPRQFNRKYSTAVPPSGATVEPHKYPWYVIGRPLRALAYRKREFLKCEHGRVTIMEDFDVTLQLLRMGYQNVIITQYAQDQYVTGEPGGCSDYRDHKVHADNVHKLAKLHAGFVKLVEKQNKAVKLQAARDFGKRVEAMIFWDKAWRNSMEEIW